MPLRPALAAIRPRGPSPREIRHVHCPGCGHGFDVPKSAFSARCPRCTRYLAFRDMNVQHKLEGDLTTMGHVVVEAESQMNGKLVCGQFTNEGRFEGNATVYGPVVLGGGSLTSGRIHSSSLRIVSSATARLRVRIGSMREQRPTAEIRTTVSQMPARSIRLQNPLVGAG